MSIFIKNLHNLLELAYEYFHGRNELISNSRKGTPFLLKTTLKILIRSSKLNRKWFLLIISIKDWSICLLAYKSNISKFIKKYTLYR